MTARIPHTLMLVAALAIGGCGSTWLHAPERELYVPTVELAHPKIELALSRWHRDHPGEAARVVVTLRPHRPLPPWPNYHLEGDNMAQWRAGIRRDREALSRARAVDMAAYGRREKELAQLREVIHARERDAIELHRDIDADGRQTAAERAGHEAKLRDIHALIHHLKRGANHRACAGRGGRVVPFGYRRGPRDAWPRSTDGHAGGSRVDRAPVAIARSRTEPAGRTRHV